MLYFGDYGITYAKMIPTQFSTYSKIHISLKNITGFQYFKLIIYSYSKIKPGSKTEPGFKFVIEIASPKGSQ
jgi:hypothetical protein